MGVSDAKTANHTYRTAEAVEKLLGEQQRTNQLLEQVVALLTPGPAPAPPPLRDAWVNPLQR